MKNFFSLTLFLFLVLQGWGQKKIPAKFNCYGSYSDSLGTTTLSESWQYEYSYPPQAIENEIQGTILVSFDIIDTCTITNIKVIQGKGLGYGLDELAVEIVTAFGEEIKKNQKLCSCWRYTEKGKGNFPIRFKLK